MSVDFKPESNINNEAKSQRTPFKHTIKISEILMNNIKKNIENFHNKNNESNNKSLSTLDDKIICDFNKKNNSNSIERNNDNNTICIVNNNHKNTISNNENNNDVNNNIINAKDFNSNNNSNILNYDEESNPIDQILHTNNSLLPNKKTISNSYRSSKGFYKSKHSSVTSSASGNTNLIFSNRKNRIISEKVNIKDTEFNKLIIPYNFETKSYTIPESDIEFYDGKNYILNKLSEFNSCKITKIDRKHRPNCCQSFPLLVLVTVVMFFVLYFEYILVSILAFNPIVIYLCLLFGYEIFSFLMRGKDKLMDKCRRNDVQKMLDDFNQSPFCVEHNLKWSLGLNGYWLEIQKHT